MESRTLKALSISLALGMGLALSGCSAPAEEPKAGEPTTVNVGLPIPLVDTMPLYVAQREGFFEEENLTVKTSLLSSGDKIMSATLSGDLDIGYYTPDWVVQAVEVGDAEVQVFLGGSDVPVYSLMVGDGVKSYADLKGQRVAVSAIKASDAYLMRKMLAANGLEEGDYSVIQAGGSTDRAAALKSGSVAAALIIPPFDQGLIDEGFDRLDLSSETLTKYAWDVNWARTEWLKENADTAKSYCSAWVKAVEWLYDTGNRAAAVGILAEELKVSKETAESTYDLFVENEVWSPHGKIDRAGMGNLLDAMVEQETLKSPAPEVDKYLSDTCGA
jgi:NitT/TauT family transport system substrate-binding protein